MTDLFVNSVFFGAVLSFAFYEVGVLLRKWLKHPLVNPLLISIVLCIVFLQVTNIPYSVYNSSAHYLNYLLTPATVCLAIPLYEQFGLLKKNIKAVLAGITSGVITSVVIILLLCVVFRLRHDLYVTMLPKSITTAIGMSVAEQLGGYPSIAAVFIVITGVLGNVLAEPLLKLFRITEPVAQGIAIGTSSHAIGTGKANELGEIQGAMSGLSICVAGILTVLVSIGFSYLY